MNTRQPKGIPVGGQFAPDTHAEPAMALMAPRGYDPDTVAKGILKDLWELHTEWTRKLVYDTRQSVQAGETTHEAFIDSLLAKNHGGRCKEHEFDRFDTEMYCHDCLTSLMVDARTNPKPLPVPRSDAPGREVRHRLVLTNESVEDYESESSSTTRTVMSGDEKFHAAIRRMFNAPADAKVDVVQENWRDWEQYTEESSTTIKVTCNGETREYDGGMGSLMRAMDKERHSDPIAMALRFMTATRAERPLLKGIAAVYLRQPYAAPVPVFGKVRNVFSAEREPFMDFLHLDGRQEYIYFNQVVSILETDQSSEYNENPNVLPASAARPGPVVEKSIDPDGGEREVRAVVASQDLKNQVRGYLRVDDPAAEVEVRFEKVNFYSVEDEEFVISCAGKEVSFHNLETLLRKVAN